MGTILTSTPEMGEYSVEVRNESFILYGADSYGKHSVPHGIFVYPNYQSGCGSVEIELGDIPKIRAVLDRIEEYRKSK